MPHFTPGSFVLIALGLAIAAAATLALLLAPVAASAAPSGADTPIPSPVRVGAPAPDAARGSAEPPAGAGRAGARRCYSRAISIRKTSLGIHQWTAGQRTSWCTELVDGRRAVVAVERRSWAETGTNWELIGRHGEVRRTAGGRTLATTRFHFRLAYPWLVQNCRPRLTLAVAPDGSSTARTAVGC